MLIVAKIGKLEIEMHPEAQSWVLDACSSIEQAMAVDKDPVERELYKHAGFSPGYHALSQFTMASPHGQTCLDACDDTILKIAPDDKHYVLRWVHDYADLYDTYWWHCLHMIGAIDWLKKLVAEDVALPSDRCRHPDLHKEFCTCAEYGDVMLRSTGESLLKHFLRPDPNPAWVFCKPRVR
jgi:hypothetical protein